MIFRTVAFLLALLLIVLLVLYLVTKNKNYLELVKKITRYTITAFFIVVVIYIFMRITHL
jgi:succinate dehydrogenase hydrophobic anchor subunit